MLGKLMKYEFKLTARTLLPLYAALAALTLLMKLSSDNGDPSPLLDSTLGGIIMVAIYFAYGAMFTAVSVITVVLLIQRFYKNLLRDEGYLMHTLPVSSGKLIFSKLICTTMWVIISVIAACLSIMVITLDWVDWQNLFADLGEAITELNRHLGVHWILYALELLAMLLLALGSNILQVYAAMTLGHSFNGRKIFWSVAVYIGISTVVVFVTSLLGSWGWLNQIIHELLWNSIGNQLINTHIIMLLIIGLNLAKGLLFFCLTNWLMKHRLNLE